MQAKTEESVYLTDKEWIVLAACFGLTDIEGFFRKPVSRQLSDQDIYYICHDLLKRKILEAGKGPAGIYREIMETVGEAREMFLISARELSAPVCCYPGKAVVRSQISPLEANSLRIGLLSREDFANEFESGSFIPDVELNALEPDPKAAERIRELLCDPSFRGTKVLEMDRLPENVTMMVQRIRRSDGSVFCRIFLLEDGGRDYAAVDRDGCFGIFPYEKEEFGKLIRNMLKESEHL